MAQGERHCYHLRQSLSAQLGCILGRSPAAKLIFPALLATLAASALAQGRLQRRFETMVNVGMQAPVVQLTDTAGKQWDLSALRDKKWVVIEFGSCT